MSLELARVILEALRAPGDEARKLRRDLAAVLVLELKVAPAAAALPELLTLAEVAKMVGRTRHALQEAFRRGRKAGELHPLDRPGVVVAVDGVRRWPRHAIEAYIAAVSR